MTLHEKVAIVQQVICQYHLLRDVAKEFRVTIPTVSNLVKKAKNNVKFFQEIISQKQEVKNTHERLKQIILDKIKEDHFIESIHEF